MEEQTIRQIKYVKIVSPEWEWSDMFSSSTMPGRIYFDVQYESAEQVSRLLNKAKEMFEADRRHNWMKDPEVYTYWKTVDVK